MIGPESSDKGEGAPNQRWKGVFVRGKPAVDLPDPLQTPSDVGKPLTSTDDLLAQLAGEEIDRLLAEVDDQAGAAAPMPALAPRSNAGPSSPIDLDGTPDPVVEAPAAIPTDDEIAGRLAAAPDQPDVTAELDAFFRVAARAAPDAKEPAGAKEPALLPAAPVVTREDAASNDFLETSADERAGLRAPAADVFPARPPESTAAAAVAAPAATTRHAAARSESASDDLPAYLKPLEWINAPLEKCPSALRDFIGKAAIITLVNAAAVLAYVMIFRRG